MTGDAALQRCSELLTEEELRECLSSGDAAVRRERVLARAHVRCAQHRQPVAKGASTRVKFIAEAETRGWCAAANMGGNSP